MILKFFVFLVHVFQFSIFYENQTKHDKHKVKGCLNVVLEVKIA